MTNTTTTPVRVLVVMGVSGTGKSTVAAILAERLGFALEEGDDLHPAANVAKMAAGRPLTDEDRWPWLDEIGGWIHRCLDQDTPGVITCSALRRRYRDRLRAPGVVFVHLDGTRQQIFDRLSAREGHFMPASLLDSQLDTLEPLAEDEDGVTVTLGRKPMAEADAVLTLLADRLPPAVR